LAALVAVGALAAGASSGVRQDQVTLVYLDDIYTDTASKAAQMEMIKVFEQRNPNIKIKYVAKSFGQFVPTARLVLQGANAPDVVICAAADTCNADLVKAGLVIPTDKYAKQYNWFKGIDPVLLGTTKHEKDGTTYRGNTYGMSITYDLVGLYYNKKMLRELGLKKPTTQAEFENALKVAKEAGEIPIMFGDLGKVDLTYVWMQLLAYEMNPTAIRNWQYRKKGSNINTPGAVRAVETLKRWYDAGYFSPDIFGIDQYTAVLKFNEGEGLFLPTGAWWTGLLNKLGDDAGYMLMPGKTKNAKPVAVHTLSNPLNITSKSKHPDEAAKFIAWMTSPESAKIRVKYGMNATPLWAVKAKDAPSATGREVLSEFIRMNKTGQAIPFLDASPRMLLEILGSGLQSVFGGKMGAKELIEAAQKEQAAQVAERVKKGYA
jgi:raffinose/stachyose/melibiose transport system substrate-binding protein